MIWPQKELLLKVVFYKSTSIQHAVIHHAAGLPAFLVVGFSWYL